MFDSGRDLLPVGVVGAAVQMCIRLSREQLTAALYGYALAEAAELVSSAAVENEIGLILLNHGIGDIECLATETTSKLASGDLDPIEAAWWALCAERVETVFFGGPGDECVWNAWRRAQQLRDAAYDQMTRRAVRTGVAA